MEEYVVPMYLYRCGKCKHEEQVLRSFKDYEIVPTTEDNSSLPDKCVDGEEHKWERILQPLLQAIKWPGSTGSVKGNA